MIGNFPQIDKLFVFPVIITGIIGLLFFLLALFTLSKKRILKCWLLGVSSLGFLFTSLIISLIGVNLDTYQRLTKEELIASIQFWQSGSQQFLAVLTQSDAGDGQSYLLNGDEWQIDARILKWKPTAIVAGLDSRYRLERLSGRYRNIDQERYDQRSIFDLSSEPGLELWPVLIKLQNHLDWIDTYYGNSVYLPMADQAIYQIVLTQSGILSRLGNEQARRTVANW
jgi:hypothetical protein